MEAGAERVYVWELPVRAAHWLIFSSAAVLVATGFYIGSPFLIGGQLLMQTIRVVHWYAAIVFDVVLLGRIYWMFMGNRYARWDQFIPASGRRLRDIRAMLGFWFFTRREPPPEVGVDPLRGLIFAGVFALEFLMMATGFALYSVTVAATSLMAGFRFLVPIFGGLPNARWIHHAGMWLLLWFVVFHVYSGVLQTLTERNATIESIFSGYKFVRRDS